MADNEERFLGIERRLADLQKYLDSIIWNVRETKNQLEKLANSFIKIEDKILASK